MDAEKVLKRLVRIGTVTDIDNAKRKARVKFQDCNMTSGWLYVLDTHLTIYLPVFNGDGFVLGGIGG